MTTNASVLRRLRSLIREGKKLAELKKGDAKQRQSAWLTGAHNIVRIVCNDPEHTYLRNIISLRQAAHSFNLSEIVGEATAMLEHLLKDAQAGLLESVADKARAEAFDDFLDHADAYLQTGKKNEAGVIAGVVFEDLVRRTCRRLDISESGENLDSLITALQKANFLSPVKAKRARAAAHVRTKATHAQWDDFQLGDVRATIALCREMIETNFGDQRT